MPLLSSLIAAQSGLRAATAGLSATSHNVANASNRDFTRRRVVQSNADPVPYANLWIGRGVRTEAIARITDTILGSRRIAQQGRTSESSEQYKALSAIEGLFEEADTSGIREQFDKFMNTLVLASSDPSDVGLRYGALSAGEAFTRTVRQTATGLQEQLDALSETVEGYEEGINAQLEEIAVLNAKLQGVVGGEMAAGDLADRRDAIIKDLSQKLGTTVHFNRDDTATVFLGGHAIVSGTVARKVDIVTYPNAQPDVFVSAGSGQLNVSSAVGGEVGGRLAARTQIAGYLDSLDTFVTDFTNAFNTQHAAGQDLNGNAGGNVFAFANSPGPALSFSLDPGIVGNPSQLAFSDGGGIGDGDNLALLVGLESSNIVNGTQPGLYLSRLTAQVGRDVASTFDAASQQEAIMADLDELNSQLNGVDLDEEASNLVQYQASYQAAARVISVTNGLLGDLMSLV